MLLSVSHRRFSRKCIGFILQYPWGGEQEKAFQSLKAKLCDSHVLRIPLLGVPLCLHTDAIGTAVSATLEQKDASGIEHPLALVRN